jgi:hypothetical protein
MHFCTHLDFWVIATPPALALFIVISLYISAIFCTILLIITKKDFQMCTKSGRDVLKQEKDVLKLERMFKNRKRTF